MNILILGATGNTGSEVIRQLHARGFQPKVLLRDTAKAQALEIPPADVIKGDFADYPSLEKAFSDIDRLYVAMPPHPDNIQWMANVIKAAKHRDVKRIVKLSGFGANESAGSEIIRTHASTDKLIHASGIEYTILQPNSFFQNLYGSAATIKDHGAFYLPLGNAAQSVIDLGDIAAVAVEALTDSGHANAIYQLSGPEALTYAQQAKLLSDAAGTPINYVPVSSEAAQQSMLDAGMNAWQAEKLAEILAWFGQYEYDTVTDDVARVLGRPPRKFEDFAQEFAASL